MNSAGGAKSASTARVIFAACLAGLGVLHIIFGEEVTRLFPQWPNGLPGRPMWAHLAGVLLLICGGMILLKRQPRQAAAVLGLVILLSVIGLHLPRSLRSANFGDEWLNFFKWLCMAGGAFVVASGYPADKSVLSLLDRLIEFFAGGAKWYLAAFMVGAAILHLRYTEFIAPFIPVWIPWRIFWVQFTAVALGAGAVGILIPATARLAALLTSLMFFLWLPLVHLPRTVADPLHNSGWCEMCEIVAFSAIAFLLAPPKRSSAPS